MANPDSRVTIHMAASLEPGFVEAFLKTIDCYVMGSRTYETALRFEAQGFYSGDLKRFVDERLRSAFRNIWFVGGGMVAAECLRLGLADEVRYSILPILIGDGIPFFERLDRDVPLHLVGVKGYKSGTIELHYEAIKNRTTSPAI